MLKQIIREPLLHFLIAGALIFAGYAALVDPKTTEETYTIRIGNAEMQFLRAQYEKLWGRPPAADPVAPLLFPFSETSGYTTKV